MEGLGEKVHIQQNEKQNLIDTDHSGKVIGGRGRWEQVEEDRGGTWWRKETCFGAVNTPYCVQMMCCRTGRLKPVEFLNQRHSSKFNKN